jgi:hypothetical protein
LDKWDDKILNWTKKHGVVSTTPVSINFTMEIKNLILMIYLSIATEIFNCYWNQFLFWRKLLLIYVTPRVTKTLKKVINKWLGAVTRLNQKANFKNKVSDSNYREINLNFFFEWNSKFWSFFGKNLFFLAIRCNEDHASQISSKYKFLKNFGEFLSKFN